MADPGLRREVDDAADLARIEIPAGTKARDDRGGGPTIVLAQKRSPLRNRELDPRLLDAFDLFAATFPAGTVVGAPKVRAMELIDGLEPARRGVYAGTVGYFGHDGRMDQAIAIRTVWFADGRYTYQAGAGVVADSVPDREYDEIRAKAGALEAALRLAEEGL